MNDRTITGNIQIRTRHWAILPWGTDNHKELVFSGRKQNGEQTWCDMLQYAFNSCADASKLNGLRLRTILLQLKNIDYRPLTYINLFILIMNFKASATRSAMTDKLNSGFLSSRSYGKVSLLIKKRFGVVFEM